jgi:hypothetical protein
MSEQTREQEQRPDLKPPRQVTVQPQEPAPWKGGPPKQPQRPDKGPRPAPEGEQDQRTNKDRDGLE